MKDFLNYFHILMASSIFIKGCYYFLESKSKKDEKDKKIYKYKLISSLYTPVGLVYMTFAIILYLLEREIFTHFGFFSLQITLILDIFLKAAVDSRLKFEENLKEKET